MPQLYSIVRGKVGKPVEFGMAWGITRLGGGFSLATVSATKTELVDTSYAVQAVEDLKGLFGKAPRAYAYGVGTARTTWSSCANSESGMLAWHRGDVHRGRWRGR